MPKPKSEPNSTDEVATITRSVPLDVTFPGLRRVDREAFYKRLYETIDDLTAMCNMVLRSLWLVDRGAVKTETPEPINLSKLAYDLLRGSRQLGVDGTFIRTAQHPLQSGNITCYSGPRSLILTRLKTDRNDVIAGKKSFPTFKRVPILIRGDNLKLRKDKSIQLNVFGPDENGKRARPLVLHPCGRLDGSRKAILERCLRPEETGYKLGQAALQWQQRPGRKGRWRLFLTVTHPVGPQAMQADAEKAPRPVIAAGIDIGLRYAAVGAFVDADGNVLEKVRPLFERWPKRTLRSVVRFEVDRRERLAYNKLDLQIRAGRGRGRKLRPLVKNADRIERTNKTMIEQTVSKVVRECVRRGVTLICVENHSWTQDVTRKRADRADSRSEARRINRRYAQLHQAAIREQFLWVCKREGIDCVVIDNDAWTSRQCHRCGQEYRHDHIKRPLDLDQQYNGVEPYGRITLDRFRCEPAPNGCGYEGQDDFNAAVNIAHRGLTKFLGRQVGHKVPELKMRTRKKVVDEQPVAK